MSGGDRAKADAVAASYHLLGRLGLTTRQIADVVVKKVRGDVATRYSFRDRKIDVLVLNAGVMEGGSMVDVPLMHGLLKAVPARAALLLPRIAAPLAAHSRVPLHGPSHLCSQRPTVRKPPQCPTWASASWAAGPMG